MIIPVYNAENYLRAALDSVLSQSLTEIELICIDDRSQDGSLAIMRAYEQQDSRVHVFEAETHVNAGIARNIGIDYATGEYLAFLDSDDYLFPGALEHQYEVAVRNDADYVRSNAKGLDDETGQIDENDYMGTTRIRDEDYDTPLSIYGSDDDASRLVGLSVVPWAALYKRLFVMKNNLRFNNLFCVNDRSFQRSVLINAQRVVVDRYHAVVHRRNNSDSLVGKRAANFDCEFRSYGIIDGMTAALPLFLRNMIMGSELLDIYTWQNRLKDEPGVTEQTEQFVQTLDLNYGENAFEYYWYFRLLELKHKNAENLFFGVTSEQLAYLVGAGYFLKKDVERLNTDRELAVKVYDSLSYRVGCAITAPLRALKKLARKNAD